MTADDQGKTQIYCNAEEICRISFTHKMQISKIIRNYLVSTQILLSSADMITLYMNVAYYFQSSCHLSFDFIALYTHCCHHMICCLASHCRLSPTLNDLLYIVTIKRAL